MIFEMWYWVVCNVSFSVSDETHVSETLFPIMLWILLFHSLRGKAQVEALLRYVVEEPPEDADSKRSYKFVISHFIVDLNHLCDI